MRLIWTLLDLYSAIIIIRALLSWFNLDPRNQLVQVLSMITEPILAPLRALVPPQRLGGLDVSPVIALVAIQLIKRFLIGLM